MSNTNSPNKNVFVCNNPLIRFFLTEIRNKNSEPLKFRSYMKEASKYLVYEALSNIEIKTKEIETPVAIAEGIEFKNKFIVAPILRAGLSMVDGIIEVLPFAQIRHIGLYRNEETLQPVEYYVKLPDAIDENTNVLIIDPMLATGGSAISAVDVFKKRGVKGSSIKFISLIASKIGVQKLMEAHNDIELYCANIDSELNEKGYIVPGLGDAGDRCFGT